MTKTVGTWHPEFNRCFNNGLWGPPGKPCPQVSTAKNTATHKKVMSASGLNMNEEEKSNDALLSLIVKLIRTNPKEVIGILKSNNFHVKDNPSSEDLIVAVAHAMSRSKKLSLEMLEAVKKMELHQFSADSTDSTGAATTISDITNLISSGAKGLDAVGNLFGGNKRAQATVSTSNAQAEQAKADAARAQAEAQKAMIDKLAAQKSASGKSKAGLYIGIAVGVVLLLGGGFVVMRMMKGKSSAAAA